MMASLLSFPLFVFSNLLLFIVDAPRASKGFSKIVLLMDVYSTLISNKMAINKEAVEFLDWARKESRRPSSFIDPHIIALTFGWKALDKLEEFFDKHMKSVFATDAANDDEELKTQGYNLITYFLSPKGEVQPMIIDRDHNWDGLLVGLQGSKNLRVLRDHLRNAFPQMGNLDSKLLLLIDGTKANYPVNVCVKQCYQHGSFVIPIDAFVTGQESQSEEQQHSKSQLRLHQVVSILQKLVDDHQNSGAPITMNELLDRFPPPKDEKCSYSVENPNPFYSALVMELTGLRYLSEESATAYLTQLFQTKLPPSSTGDAFDVLAFFCDYVRIPVILGCSDVEHLARVVFDQVVGQSRALRSSKVTPRLIFGKKPHLFYFDQSFLSILLPQRITLIIHVIKKSEYEEYANKLTGEDVDRPNICYVFGTADYTAGASQGESELLDKEPGTVGRRIGRRLKKVGSAMASFGKKLFSPVRSVFRWCFPKKRAKDSKQETTLMPPRGSSSRKTPQLQQSPLQPEASALRPQIVQNEKEKALSSLGTLSDGSVQVVKTLQSIRSAFTGTEQDRVTEAMHRLTERLPGQVACFSWKGRLDF